MDSQRCCICNRKMSASNGSCTVFGQFHGSCANRAEDYVRAMAKINQTTADAFLKEGGKPSLQTMDEKMATFVRTGA